MEDDAMNQPAMITISEAVKMRGITMHRLNNSCLSYLIIDSFH